MRLVLILVVLAAVLLPAARASAACTPLDSRRRKIVRYRIKPPRTPKGKVLCLPPGATKPTAC